MDIHTFRKALAEARSHIEGITRENGHTASLVVLQEDLHVAEYALSATSDAKEREAFWHVVEWWQANAVAAMSDDNFTRTQNTYLRRAEGRHCSISLGVMERGVDDEEPDTIFCMRAHLFANRNDAIQIKLMNNLGD